MAKVIGPSKADRPTAGVAAAGVAMKQILQNSMERWGMALNIELSLVCQTIATVCNGLVQCITAWGCKSVKLSAATSNSLFFSIKIPKFSIRLNSIE